MASPSQNSVGITSYNPWAFGNYSSMLTGYKWGGALGTGVTLPYSFPGAPSWWASNYSTKYEPGSYNIFEQTHRTAAVAALNAWALYSNVAFTQVADTQTTVGEIRFAFSTRVNAGSAAHAYNPGSTPAAGDVWVSTSYSDDSTAKGGYLYFTLMHEIGHSLGLNHSFNLPSNFDNYFYSIMSYTASPWSADGDNTATFYPTTPMWFDILAIQSIYGRDMTTNAGNTTYQFNGGTYFQTIYDAGGNDSIVYNGGLSCDIDLSTGAFSSLSAAIYFSYGENSRYTVCIGPYTVIENATGNGGADIIDGNSVNNVLNGRGGADTLRGLDGGDTLYGGPGNDRLVGGAGKDFLRGDGDTDTFAFNAVGEIGKVAGARDIILDFNRSFDYIDLRNIDANTSTPAFNDVFKLVAAAGQVFSGVKGELRWFQSNPAGEASDRTFLIGDVNGDRVRDFQLECVGLFTPRANTDILL